MALAHEKLGHTGQGLWHHQNMQLPAYIQHIAKDLVTERGMTMSQAIATAIEMCRRWAKGGGDVKPDTQAKAAAAIAEFDRLRAKAAVTRSEPMSDYDADGLDSSWDGDLEDLPDLHGLDVPDFEALDPSPAGDVARAAKLGSGARFKALKAKLAAKGASDPGALAAWIGRKKFGRKRFAALAGKARSKPATASRAGPWQEIIRPFVLEDLHVMRSADGEPSGRVIEGYAAVFNDPAPIHDNYGDYEEVIDPHAFDAALARMSQRPGGIASAVRVLFNHGRTVGGQEAPEFQKPIGRALLVQPDQKGLLTRTELNRTSLAEDVLEMVRSGSITGMSFFGNIIRSDPELRGPGDKYRPRGRALGRVRRVMLGLREYSPVVWEAYPGATFQGAVRMGDPEPFDVTATDGGPDGLEDDTPDIDGGAAGSVPEDTTSARYHQHALYAMRSREARETKGLNW